MNNLDKNNSKYSLSRFNISTVDKNNNLLVFNSLSGKYYKFLGIGDINKKEMLELFLNNKIVNKMINNRFIIKNIINEDSIIDELYKKYVIERDRLDIVILTTNSCNFDCIYCFQHKNKCSLNNNQYNGILNFIIDKVNTHNYRNIRLRWFGGEPLLEKKKIIEFSKKLKEFCASKKISYGASITTNGYLLDLDTFCKLYESKVLSYQISIDGTSQIHNRNRPLKNGKGTFDQIISNLIKIKEQTPYSMFNINVRINFSNDLIEQADNIIQFYKNNFNNDSRFLFSFIPIFDWSATDNDKEKSNNISQILTSHNSVFNLMKKYASQVRFEIWKELIIASNHCWAGTEHGYAINGNGDILKCDFKLENFPENVIGHISSTNGEIIFDKDKDSIWSFKTPLNKCYNCAAFPICMSTMCGAARIENKMENKCERQINILKNYIEIESYSKNNKYEDIII